MAGPDETHDATHDETRATRTSYDAIADRYLAEIGDELSARPLERGLLATVAELSAGGVVVDAGSGPGHVAAHLAATGASVTAIDLSPAMCALAARAGVRAVAGDLTALPMRSGAAYGVVCLFAVIHLDERDRALAYRELARVLRPGGPLLLGFHISSTQTAGGDAHRPASMWDIPVELTFRYLLPDDEIAVLQDAGFTLNARVERQPGPGEHASVRCYLLAVRI